MAYCPRCRKEVADRWIECPVCRTEVIRKETVYRKDTSVKLNRLPGLEEKKQYNMFGRIMGVLKFEGLTFENMSITQPTGEAMLLYLLSIILSSILYSTDSYKSLLASLPGKIPEISGGLTAAGMLVGLIIMVFSALTAHLFLRIMGGNGNLMTTFTTMLFVSSVWGITYLLLVGFMAIAGASLLYLPLLSLTLFLIITLEYVTAFSVVHGISKKASAVAVVLSYSAQVVLFVVLVLKAGLL
ncbi:MAG: RING finger protein [Candidatus Altiarchaeota archaeon]